MTTSTSSTATRRSPISTTPNSIATQKKNIVINGKVLPNKYFEDPRNVLLVGLTDGFQLFKRGKHTAWPIIFLNSNLSPADRFSIFTVLCAGIIPGPKKPKDFNSFFYVAVKELNDAVAGVPAYDAFANEAFLLRVFAMIMSGDMPAIALAWLMSKAPGAKVPCHTCPIEGIRIIGTRNNSHYLPLQRPPGYPPSGYSIKKLPPLRQHDQWMRQACRIDQTADPKEREQCSCKYGINGITIVSHLPGVSFPDSFPSDFMHLLENTLHNYISLMCGEFKGFNNGWENYIINASTWNEIGRLTADANATIPSSFGHRIPNVSQDCTYFTAEAYVVWSTMYAPILLCGRFPDKKFYDHYQLLISIVNRCMGFTSTKTERNALCQDILTWYQQYEE